MQRGLAFKSESSPRLGGIFSSKVRKMGHVGGYLINDFSAAGKSGISRINGKKPRSTGLYAGT